MFLSTGRAYDIPAVALRFFNTYGPRQALSNPYTGVMAIFSGRLLNYKPPVIYEDGKQSRDFIQRESQLP
jgi:dTDP-L-rhamnose 4-epimerase